MAAPASAPPLPGLTKLYTDGLPELRTTKPRDIAIWLHTLVGNWASSTGYDASFAGTESDPAKVRDALRYMVASVKDNVPFQEALRACSTPAQAHQMVLDKWLGGTIYRHRVLKQNVAPVKT